MKKVIIYSILLIVIVLLAIPKITPLFENGVMQGPDGSGGAGAGGAGAGAGAGGAGGAGGAESLLPVDVVVMQYSSVTDRIFSSGTVEANERIDLRAEVTGIVEAIYLTEGSRVQEGDLLLKINDSELQAQKSRAEYRYNLAAQQEERQRRLLEKGGVSQEDYDATLNQVNVFRSEMQLIDAQLEKTEIRAPFSGRIGLKYVSKGQFIGPDQPIASLQELDRVKIDFSVPERYAGRVQTGDLMRFDVQGIDSTFVGEVYAIEPRINTDTRTLSLRAISDNPEFLLYPGAFANIELVLEEIEEALMVPTISLIPGLNSQKVYVAVDGMVEERIVKTGIRTSEKVQILEGLNPGDQVLTTGLLQARPGLAIRVVSHQPEDRGQQ
ncbi:MAG: efflux transporter periplasmic adaptor subunit [Bacteroidetes bacterium]|jgi:membrane fusion protein (multidrug efflux system)|nr:MAG: efflux transporter periplasmic adaptor subunit [Bacteroidota bacterium]